MRISKSQYLNHLVCPYYAYQDYWYPQMMDQADQELINQGNEVEALAQECWPKAQMIGSQAINQIPTKPGIYFQVAAQSPQGWLAVADIIQITDDGQYHLIEIKSSSSPKDRHISDIGFQKLVFDQAGFELKSTSLLLLDKNYVFKGRLEPQKMFIREEKTQEAASKQIEIKEHLDEMSLYLDQKTPPACDCLYKTRNQQCPFFAEVWRPPTNPIWDLPRLSQKAIKNLVERNILAIKDIPEDYQLSSRQTRQRQAYLAPGPLIEVKEIQGELKSLSYPLYFIDYEATHTALPLFERSWPFAQIAFQYSLHYFNQEGGAQQHAEYLVQEPNNECLSDLCQSLKEKIGPQGTLIAWNKSFEQKIHSNLSLIFPNLKAFFADLNERFYDLEQIFAKQYYLDAGFGGRTSIKSVLPVVVPEYDYSDLNIQDGDTASRRWLQAQNNPEQKDKIFADLKKYCARDTEAMVKIWQKLKEVSCV